MVPKASSCLLGLLNQRKIGPLDLTAAKTERIIFIGGGCGGGSGGNVMQRGWSAKDCQWTPDQLYEYYNTLYLRPPVPGRLELRIVTCHHLGVESRCTFVWLHGALRSKRSRSAEILADSQLSSRRQTAL